MEHEKHIQVKPEISVQKKKLEAGIEKITLA